MDWGYRIRSTCYLIDHTTSIMSQSCWRWFYPFADIITEWDYFLDTVYSIYTLDCKIVVMVIIQWYIQSSSSWAAVRRACEKRLSTELIGQMFRSPQFCHPWELLCGLPLWLLIAYVQLKLQFFLSSLSLTLGWYDIRFSRLVRMWLYSAANNYEDRWWGHWQWRRWYNREYIRPRQPTFIQHTNRWIFKHDTSDGTTLFLTSTGGMTVCTT